VNKLGEHERYQSDGWDQHVHHIISKIAESK